MCLSYWKKFLSNVTLEPKIFIYIFGRSLTLGSALQTNLLMWKVCTVTLGFNETICNDLTNENNTDIEVEVQHKVNEFSFIRQWIGTPPPIIYALLLGALSDHYGRKWLLQY